MATAVVKFYIHNNYFNKFKYVSFCSTENVKPVHSGNIQNPKSLDYCNSEL